MGGAKNCPETPRQRMIGMMYLVLTAMLALNVSTDILNGFTLVDNSLHSSITASDTRNAKLYRDFQAANADNPEKIQEWFDKAKEVQYRADSLYNYLQNFKDQLAIMADGRGRFEKLKAEGLDPTMHIQGNSNLDVTGTYALVQGHGLELKDIVAYYRDYASELVESDPALRHAIQTALATERGYNAHDKDSCDWEIAVFDGMPVGASVTILTKMQNDVRTTEGQVIQYLMDRTDAGDLRVNKLSAYVMANSDVVMRGGKYHAQILLAAVDSTQRPEYYVEGVRLNDQGVYEVPATSTGLKKYTGWISFMNPATGLMDKLPFNGEYTVTEPAVIISNEELDIMYRGYDNKFSVSVPGVSNEKIKVTVNGGQVKKQGERWIIVPGDNTKEITVNVSAELDGKMQNLPPKKYRVRKLPDPSPFFNSREKDYASGEISSSALTHNTGVVTVSYGTDGILNLPFTVTSFTLFVNGQYLDTKGNKFTREQLDKLGKLRSGSFVMIENIRAIGPNGKELRVPSSLAFKLN